MEGIFTTIRHLCPTLSSWTTVEKAQVMACLTLGLRPTTCVEIGVWSGASAVPVALALREIGFGTLHCIDPWSAAASVEGQVNPADKDWWAKQQPHEWAFNTFNTTIDKYGLSNCVKVHRVKSDDIAPMTDIGILHVDANHGETATRDVARFAPNVILGGFVILDDLDWAGGAVRRAEADLLKMGFRMLYRLGNGACYQRISNA